MATQIDLGAVVPIGKGDWNSSATYERANIVRHNSTAWVCKVATSKGVEPSESSSDWYLLVKDMSAVTSINGMRGDVTIDSILTNPSTDDNSLKIASTSWVKTKVDNAIDEVNTELSQVSSTASTALQTANSADTTANNALSKAEEASKDVANVMSAVGQVQTQVTEAIEIDSSGYSFGQHWVRYKDGRQIIYSDWESNFANTSIRTFAKPFTTNPALIGFDNENIPANTERRNKFSDITGTYFKINDWAYGSVQKSGCWVAMGTWK